MRHYLSDLEWSIVKPLLPPVKNCGRKRETDLREIVNSILYLLNEGCKFSETYASLFDT
ncbi:MAG: transposase [Waterburya sp.]